MVHIVIDLEMNPINKEFKEVRKFLLDEVIEFGAVKLDENYRQIDEFQCYVKPVYSETINKHITKLTGITTETVADKAGFVEEFNNFFKWIGGWDMKIYSWSPSDIKQLKNECAYKIPKFDVRRLERQWIDVQKEFDDRLGLHSNLGLKYAVGAMDRNFEGTHHTALADAANAAAILALMQDDEAFFKTMQPVIDLLRPQEFSQSIGDLFPELADLKFD
ncbi:MAG: exonuclease domain-containing protein [Selenomonadaceae bacterium]|nr:exonuclease domain-containing protein [Selenomonadaceae bacterium]